MELVLFFGCLAGIGMGLFLLDCAFTRRRLKRLEAQARRLGFSFERMAQPFEGSNLKGLSVLTDASAAVINVMQGPAGQCQATIFELARLNPACSTVAATTVAAFRCACGQLPVFQIGRESFAHRIGDALGGKADHDLGQGEQLFVHCPDECQARDFLSAAKLERLRVNVQHFRIEASPDWILVYRPGMRIRPEALPEFIRGTSLIAAGLLERNPAPVAAQ